MLHSIREVCELTGRSRSSIYRMFGRGDLTYIVGKDGKRRVETSELLRVFDDINFNDSPTLSEPLEGRTAPTPAAGDPYVTARELTDLRGMIHELREELDDLREDNRRLLRLLEYQTTQHPQPAPTHAPQTEAASSAIPQPETTASPSEEQDEEETVPVTSVAEQGWKAYREQRAKQLDTEQQKEKEPESPPSPATGSGTAITGGELGVWLKNFFFGEWQRR